jgi:prefoldin subunit 5
MSNGFSVESLDRGIESCKKNIKTFEDAIDKERNTIKDYRHMIETIERKEREAKIREEMSSHIEVVRDTDPILNS